MKPPSIASHSPEYLNKLHEINIPPHKLNRKVSSSLNFDKVPSFDSLLDSSQNEGLSDSASPIRSDYVETKSVFSPHIIEEKLANAMLQRFPSFREKIRMLLIKSSCTSFPRSKLQSDNNTYLRQVVEYLLDQPSCSSPSVSSVSSPPFSPSPASQDVSLKYSLKPFYVVDLGRLVVQMARFQAALPMVKPFYAMKCNPNLNLMSVLAAMGVSFDCASAPEFEMVLENQLACPSEGIIFANPCKTIPDMKRAHETGVRMTTFDNMKELEKLSIYMPTCRALLRIKTEDSAAQCSFSTKFGADMKDVRRLLERANELSVEVVGCSFHVGSGNGDLMAYQNAILNAYQVFQIGKEIGFSMDLLDLGGGFPGDEFSVVDETKEKMSEENTNPARSFEEIAEVIRNLLTQYFPNTVVIAEPGRFFTATSHTLVMNIHGMREVPTTYQGEPTLEYQYYANDGLYYSFNCILFDHAHPKLELLRPKPSSKLFLTTIFGPTCDSMDCILKRELFPELGVGEWIFSPNMGSYTTSAGTAFNGFATKETRYICSLNLELARRALNMHPEKTK